jgi:hypothetical protein
MRKANYREFTTNLRERGNTLALDSFTILRSASQECIEACSEGLLAELLAR